MNTKVTKKEFIDLLTSHETEFLGAINNRPNELHDFIADRLRNYKPDEKSVFRTVVKKQTNSMQFSNGSWLYFDGVGEKTYWKIGNIIYQQVEIDYSKDFTCSENGVFYSAVVYYVK